MQAITELLRNKGVFINHKTVERLMKDMGLYAKTNKRRKYKSYKGEIERIAPNLVNRKFYAKEPNKLWATDVSEFKLRESKLYLSPIKDLGTGEIVSFNISQSPNFQQVLDMLEKAFSKNKNLEGLVFHSDQGWQYQMSSYSKILSSRGIRQSMSRKGCCIDNGRMESFFGTMKNEMFYGHENEFRSIDELKRAMVEYIHYYNHARIQSRLGGMSPLQYRRCVFKM